MGRYSVGDEPEGFITAWSGDLASDLPPEMPTMLLPLPQLTRPADDTLRAKDPHFMREVLHALRKKRW
ncbi:hypothetical protein GCM10023222_39730 [Saccharopolyspora cebuensis]